MKKYFLALSFLLLSTIGYSTEIERSKNNVWGDMTVSGNVDIDKDLTVGGTITFSSATITADKIEVSTITARDVSGIRIENSSNIELIKIDDDGYSSFKSSVQVLGTLDVAGDIIAGGTVDGRDIASDGVVLDAVVVSTGAIQAELDAVILSTGTLVKKSGDTMTGDLTAPNFNATYAVTASTGLFSTALTIGEGTAGVDYALTFDGEDNDGVITWLEDEDMFDIACDLRLSTGAIAINTSEPVYPIHISSDHANALSVGLLLDNEIAGAGGASGLRLRSVAASGNVRCKAGIFFERTEAGGVGSLHLAVEGTNDDSNAELTDAKITIGADGEVGINDTTPSEQFDVNGTMQATGLKLNAGQEVVEISTDTTLSGNSDTAIPTEKAIKTYVDIVSTGSFVSKTGDTMTGDLTAPNFNATYSVSASTAIFGGIDINQTNVFGLYPNSIVLKSSGVISFFDDTTVPIQSMIRGEKGRLDLNVHNDADPGVINIYGNIWQHEANWNTFKGTTTFDDNVGIGTAIPTERLEVIGTIKATGLTLNGSTLLQSSATVIGSLYVNDTNTRIFEDGSSNLSFTDAVAGTKTLTQLAASAGSNTEIQYNDSGFPGASGAFRYDDSTFAVTLGSGTATDPIINFDGDTTDGSIAWNGSDGVLEVTFPDDNDECGMSIMNSDGGIQFINDSNTANQNEPHMEMFASGTLPNRIEAQSVTDTGSEPILEFSVRAGGTSVVTRPMFEWLNSSTCHMRMLANGNLALGNITPTYQLELNADSAAKPTSNTWTITSDERLKENITTISGALDKLTSLRGVTYNWIDPSKQGNCEGTYMGLISQEVEPIFPNWVSEKKLTPEQIAVGEIAYKDLTIIGFEGLVAEAMKELKAKIAELEARIEALE